MAWARAAATAPGPDTGACSIDSACPLVVTRCGVDARPTSDSARATASSGAAASAASSSCIAISRLIMAATSVKPPSRTAAASAAGISTGSVDCAAAGSSRAHHQPRSAPRRAAISSAASASARSWKEIAGASGGATSPARNRNGVMPRSAASMRNASVCDGAPSRIRPRSSCRTSTISPAPTPFRLAVRNASSTTGMVRPIASRRVARSARRCTRTVATDQLRTMARAVAACRYTCAEASICTIWPRAEVTSMRAFAPEMSRTTPCTLSTPAV